MNLLTLQRRMAGAVMMPLTPAERMRPKNHRGRSMRKVAAEFIKPNDRLSSFERLEIYNRQYWYRVLDSFAEDFPGLRAVLGDRSFDRVAQAYISECPSRSFTMRDLGSRLESWLGKRPRFAGSRQKLALDMVRLEWAEIEAFDGPAQPALRPEDLAGANQRLRLKLQPYIQLLQLSYPVDDLLLEVRDDEDTEFASNAFQERRKRKRVRAVARMEPAEIYLAVHRMDDSVYFRRLDCEEFVVLSALRSGKFLGQAIAAAFHNSAIPKDERAANVEGWFRNWSTLGWFCRPAAAKRVLARGA
jgi:hypothetical protein